MEGIAELKADGWVPESIAAIKDIAGPLFCTPLIARARGDGETTKLFVLRKLVIPNDGWTEMMSARLRKHSRPARNAPPTELEFWATFALFLADQLRRGKSSHSVTVPLDGPQKELENLLVSKDRRETLTASLTLDEDEFRSLFAKLSQRWAENIEPGCIFAVDETILGSHSKKARDQGNLKFIQGKPHPKGYFFVGGLQCFAYSKLSYLIDCEWKWSFSSPDMGEALLLVVQRAEQTLQRPLVVLADPGYPSAKLLDGPHAQITSKFIASASISEVSGDLRSLPTIIGPHAKPDTPYVYTHKARQLIAYVEKKPKYTQCLVTNATEFFGPPPEKPTFSFTQALTLASNFTTAQLQSFTNWPPPSTPTVASNSWKYVSEVTGVSLSSPVDHTGHVTSGSLKKLGLPNLKSVAAQLNIPKSSSMQKAQLMKAILKIHPLARAEESDEDEESGEDEEIDEDEATAIPAPTRESKAKKRPLSSTDKRAIAQFMPPAKKPSFVELYTDHYGLQDRMNSILYSTFHVASRAQPESKAFWAAICLSLYNTYTLWCEHRITSQQTAQQKLAAANSSPSPSQFYLSLFLELKEYCEELKENENKPLSRRTSLG